MAEFVNAIHLYTEDQGAVIDGLAEVMRRDGFELIPNILGDPPEHEDPTRSRHRRFLVSPSTQDWVTIFDENFVEIFTLAPRLARELKVAALFLWGQGDKSWGYTLTEGEHSLDQFSTDPNYIDGPSLGRPEVLCEYGTASLEQFKRLFSEGKGLPRASVRAFATMFGIANGGTDFEQLKSGETGEVVAFDEFVEMTFLKRQVAAGGEPSKP